jgi:hypothetical protein
MFADYPPSTDSSLRNPRPSCQRSNNSLRYTAKPDLGHKSDQSRLDPEPGRTPAPRMGPVRLSRDLKHKGFTFFVNQNVQKRQQKIRRLSQKPISALNYQLSASQLLDYVSDIERGRTISIRLLHHAAFDPANFFRGPLRSNIVSPNKEHHGLNKLERMMQH